MQFTQLNSESHQLQMPQYIHFLKHNSRPQCPAASFKQDVKKANSQMLWPRFTNIPHPGYESSHLLGFMVHFKCSRENKMLASKDVKIQPIRSLTLQSEF